MKKLTSSLEDYIEAVSMLESEKGFASVSSVSSMLGVKKSSAHCALKNLKDRKLINFERYGKITLTPSGRKISSGILNSHHKLAELFFEVIGIEKNAAIRQACVLEHELDRSSYSKICDFIFFLKKHPSFLDSYRRQRHGK